MNMGIVAGLIKALAPGVDPQVIEQAVTDWLDDHPEATTTVQDGSITEAKLAQDVLAELGEIDGLKEAIGNVVDNEADSKNLLDPSKCTSNFIYDNGSLQENSDYTCSGLIPVEYGKKYFFSMRLTAETSTIGTTRHVSELLDSDGNYISGTVNNVSSTEGLLVDVNEANARYMRVCVRAELGTRYLQVEEGTTYSAYVAYEESPFIKMRLGNVPREQLNPIITDKVKLAFDYYEVPLEQGRQLFDRSKITVGYCDNTGYVNSNSSYVYTDKFDVTAGKTIYFSINGVAKKARYVTAYNDQDQVVSASGASASVNTYTVPSGIVAIRVTYSNPSSDATFAKFQAEYDRITAYAEYGVFFNIDDEIGKHNVLYGKKWVACGDSFTNGVTSGTIPSGKYAGFKKTYPYFIGNRNDMDIVNFSEGGRTLAFPDNPGDFTNSLTNPSASQYYQNIPEDADYITFQIGINDKGHDTGGQTPTILLGTISDNTVATYYGAWNVVLSWLIENRPHAHIGIIVTNGIQTDDNYRQAQIAIAKKYGLPYIDLNGDERTPSMHRTSNSDIASAVKTALIDKWAVDPNSDTHPNDAAHEFESTFIEQFLRSI